MMTAAVVDETSNEKPTTLIVFAKDRADFPPVSKAGDILHMQGVELDEWNGNIQITGKKESTYVVVRNEEGDDWKVIPSAKDEFCFDKDDEKKSKTMWHWAQHFLQQHSMIQSEHSFTLQQMAGLPEFNNWDKDMVVMVTGLHSFPPEQQNGRTPYGLLRIWDGTGHSSSDLYVARGSIGICKFILCAHLSFLISAEFHRRQDIFSDTGTRHQRHWRRYQKLLMLWWQRMELIRSGDCTHPKLSVAKLRMQSFGKKLIGK